MCRARGVANKILNKLPPETQDATPARNVEVTSYSPLPLPTKRLAPTLIPQKLNEGWERHTLSQSLWKNQQMHKLLFLFLIKIDVSHVKNMNFQEREKNSKQINFFLF